MKTMRHHFTVETSYGTLHAHVPDEGSVTAARERLQQDDSVWLMPTVKYLGLEDWFEPIEFKVHEPARAVA